MNFLNNTVREFIINTKEPEFYINKKGYFLIKEMAKYNLTLSQYELSYLEKYCVPINRDVIIENDKNYSTDDPRNRVFLSLTPSNLKAYGSMKAIEKVLSGGEITKWVKMTFFGIIVIGVVCLINLVVSSGVINSAS